MHIWRSVKTGSIAAVVASGIIVSGLVYLLSSQPVSAATAIGAAALVKSNAYGTQQGGRRAEVNQDDPVYLQEVVETASESALHIEFRQSVKSPFGASATNGS